MICRELIELLEKKYPPSIAESWDNPGLQVGSYEKEIKSIYIALDATGEVIRHAIDAKADLLLTHHPMLMHGLKKINDGDFYGRRVLELITHDIAYYAMHTNYDIVEMAPLAARMLALKDAQIMEKTCVLPDGREGGFGMAGELPKEMTLLQCAEYVKDVFQIPDVKIFGNPETVLNRAAVLPGSGKSMTADALRNGAEVYITGDFGHHDGIDAVDQGLNVIDAGHYGIEHIFIGQMAEELKERFPEMEICTEPIRHPFLMV